jgi:predicted RNA-binding Zn ribbon-like protein
MTAPDQVAGPIPLAALLVREFVNTVEWQVDIDSWRTPSDLVGWLSEYTGSQAGALNDDDLKLARRLREGLRSILLMHAGHDALATSIEDLNDALRLIPLRMSFDASAEVGLTSVEGSALGNPLACVLEAVEAARADGSWTRLKACSRDSCRWAYWDGSRNRSGRWCSMDGCGNYIKMKRRNDGPAASSDLVIGEHGPRAATLVDVAGRAGVSIKTVSNVVTGTVRVADGTRARVIAAIQELDYRPNLAARALATTRGRKPAALED